MWHIDTKERLIRFFKRAAFDQRFIKAHRSEKVQTKCDKSLFTQMFIHHGMKKEFHIFVTFLNIILQNLISLFLSSWHF